MTDFQRHNLLCLILSLFLFLTNSDTHQLTNSLNSFILLVHSLIYHFFTQLTQSPNSLIYPHTNSITQLNRQIKLLMSDAEKQDRDTDNQRITQLTYSIFIHSFIHYSLLIHYSFSVHLLIHYLVTQLLFIYSFSLHLLIHFSFTVHLLIHYSFTHSLFIC